MKPIFISVLDVFTNKQMIIRADLVQKIYDEEIDGRSVRVIQFINGDKEYVYNSMEYLNNLFKDL